MKKILLFVFLAFAGISFGQTKTQVDQRLIDNQGDEIYNILTNRKDYYKFLLWELDNAYQVVSSNGINPQNVLSISSIQDTDGNIFDATKVNDATTFNFIKYNFIRQKTNDVYYDLGNGTLLKFTALKVMWQQFDDSGLNTKQ